MKNKKLFTVLMALALVFTSSLVSAQDVYIPLISKGFQHQFWQAVKLGAEKAAADYKVRVTFEGPETEQMVDKQIDMLSAALAKNPQALGFAAWTARPPFPFSRRPRPRGFLSSHLTPAWTATFL